MEPILFLRGVSRRYGPTTAVARADLELREGRIACLLGPSGCGKSTILRMIAGLEPVDAGEIRISGETVSRPGETRAPETRGVGLVFQDNALFPHLDVRSNVGFGLRGMPRREREDRVLHLLEQMHVAHLADSWPHRLSGGEQQRVAVARALALKPSLLLLDEPFSGLDGTLRETIRTAMVQDLRSTGTSVLIVTHDPQEAMGIADDLILMAEGEVLQVGAPRDCYLRPVSVTAGRLLGELAVVPGRIESGRLRTVLGEMPAAGLSEGPAGLGLRPEALRLAQEGAPATVRGVRFAGDAWRVDLDLAGEVLSLRMRGDPPAPGALVFVSFDETSATVIPN